MIDAIWTQIDFQENGVYAVARIDKILLGNRDFEYYTSFHLENDSVNSTIIKSNKNLGNVGDSIEIYYLKYNFSTVLASDLRGYKSVLILSIIDVCLITMIIVALKKPQVILRFKSTLDQY